MDLIAEYQAYAGMIDQCDDADKLKDLSSRKSYIAMRREFWKQRKTFISAQDPLEKQKASVKLQ